MTYKEINQIVGEIATALGCEYAYFEVDSDGIVKAPYLLFSIPTSEYFVADDENYSEVVRLAIEYDTCERDFVAEAQIEEILRSYEFIYTKTTARVEGQAVHEVMYEMEVMLYGEREDQ